MSPSNWTEQQLQDLLRRDWAVRVLDAWAKLNSGFAFRTDTDPSDHDLDEPWICGVAHSRPHRKLARRGETPDAARLAAAEAVWPELPESVRAELGERP